MTLQDLGDRIKQSVASFSQRSSEPANDPTSANRQSKSDTITHLQEKVSRLQHEIADLSQLPANGEANVDASARAGQVDALQKELVQTQLELSKFQGRI